jgi:hypothetical protein
MYAAAPRMNRDRIRTNGSITIPKNTGNNLMIRKPMMMRMAIDARIIIDRCIRNIYEINNLDQPSSSLYL